MIESAGVFWHPLKGRAAAITMRYFGSQWFVLITSTLTAAFYEIKHRACLAKGKMNEEFQNQTLDIRDYLSPLSILKVRTLLNNMKDGQILEVWSNDLETKVVLEQIIKNSNDELLRIEKKGEYEKIYIKRGTPIDH